jgi:hypothetical protein
MTGGRFSDRLARAKALFWRYDGSTFYMSRDAADREYAALDVPREVEYQWLAALTKEKLKALSEPGNWRVISFLTHHSDFGHLGEVLRANPMGVFWEKCAFLELVVQHGGEGYRARQLSRSDLHTIKDYVEHHLPALASRVRSPKSKARVASIAESLARAP